MFWMLGDWLGGWVARRVLTATPVKEPPERHCKGYGFGNAGAPCCERAGEYNGYASGPLLFRCPKGCGCHD